MRGGKLLQQYGARSRDLIEVHLALADKASALDRQLAEGVGVVAELGGALKQRDAEVAALCDQVNTERRLNGDTGDPACRGEQLFTT